MSENNTFLPKTQVQKNSVFKGKSGKFYFRTNDGRYNVYKSKTNYEKGGELLKTISEEEAFKDLGENLNPKAKKKKKTKSPNVEPLSDHYTKVGKDYFRVGTQYYKKVLIPNKKLGIPEIQYKKWNKETIKEDHTAKVLKYVERYDTFAMFPDFHKYSHRVNVSHFGISSTAFNLCKPLPHQATKGAFPTIIQFLSHLFANEESSFYKSKIGDPLTMIIDCYRLKLQNPTQTLPVICLVSREQATGKSTALKLNYDIFGSNATVIGKEHLENSFNTTYADKLVIGVDESFIDLEKKTSKEKIKHLATEDKIFYHPKGVDPHQIDFYGWLWFASNDEFDFMKIEESDKRFWVLKVYEAKNKNPNLRQKMIKEIPHFIHYCLNTKVFHPQKSRMWFDEQLIITDQMKEVIEFTRNRLDKTILSVISDLFTTYFQTSFKIPLKELTKLINEESKYNYDKSLIKDWLYKNRGMKANKKTERCKYPTGWLNPDREFNDLNVMFNTVIGKGYVFFIDNWVTEK